MYIYPLIFISLKFKGVTECRDYRNNADRSSVNRYDLLIKIFGKIDPDGDIVKPGTENEDGTTTEGGIAQNGIVKFFQKVSTWFSNIGTWFKNLFSFSFLKR